MIAGLIAVERWRRMGQGDAPPVSAVDGVAAATEPTAADVPVPPTKPKVAELIVSGAKSDYERIRQSFSRLLPG
jgi:hypothetical protein